MPLRSKGMLITSMDVDAQHEDEFNLWYDREHVAERVAIDGFTEARRWIAIEGAPKYFATYCTQRFEDLSSPAYTRALANQTAWSKTNIGRFKNMIRVVGRITDSRGLGRGSILGVVRLRPEDRSERTIAKLHEQLDPGNEAGLISMHLLQSDPDLSKSLTEPDKPNPGAADWFVLIEGTALPAVRRVAAERFNAPELCPVSLNLYQHLWDLTKSDL